MLKWIDIPPVWLLGFLVAAWLVSPGQGGLNLTGGLIVGTGLVFIFWAAATMMAARTTVVPHMRAAELVTTGPFRYSRNPIYLGDALVLTGCLLRWDLLIALPAVIVFCWIITIRFIRPEEARLREDFGAAFDEWCSKTRRWL